MKNKIENISKITGNIIYSLVLITLILIAGASAVSALNIPGGYKLFSVQSGSMEPSIRTGSIVIVQPVNDYKINDVITYKKDKSKNSVTHRLVNIETKDDQIVYTTKGDANDAPDSEPVLKSSVLGKTLFSIPFLGYPVSFSKTQTGLIVLIIIPATLIIYSELMTIKNEAKRLLIERKKRKLNLLEKAEIAIGQEVAQAEKEVKKAEKEIEKDFKQTEEKIEKTLGIKSIKKKTTKSK
jgi:signal peptidase